MSNSGTKKGTNSTGASSPLKELGVMLGGSSSLDPMYIDAGLLWMTMGALLRRGAAMHVGMNKAHTSVILTVYDGDYPHKEFCDSIERVHHVMAALVRVYAKKPLDPEWEEIVQKYFP